MLYMIQTQRTPHSACITHAAYHYWGLGNDRKLDETVW